MRQTKQFTGHSLLAVTAHPDDEAILCGGLLAWCADLGARVSLLCLTKGEHGQGKPSVVTGRELELNAAAKLLGIHATTILAHEDGMLPWIDPERLENDIATIIKQAKPDVVITFDSDGVYGHPDHIAVHERTTTVVNQIQDNPPALYYASIPSGTMRTLVEHDRDAWQTHKGLHKPPQSILGIDDPDAWGCENLPPTFVVDAKAYGITKLEALACHRSQFQHSALAYVALKDAPKLLNKEHYRRAQVGNQAVAFIEDLVQPED